MLSGEAILLSLVWPDLGSNLQTTALEVSTLTITPPMNLRSTVLEVSTLTITPPMNLQSTVLEVSTLTITPPMNLQSTALEVSTLTITPPMQLISTCDINKMLGGSQAQYSWFYICTCNKKIIFFPCFWPEWLTRFLFMLAHRTHICQIRTNFIKSEVLLNLDSNSDL
jgi:hypothetical protein